MVDKKAEPKEKAVQEKAVKKASTGAWWKSTAKKETVKEVSDTTTSKLESPESEKKRLLNQGKKQLPQRVLPSLEHLERGQLPRKNQSTR